MQRDTFLSILALDAYNRGPNSAVTDLPEIGSIGNATIIDVPLPGGSIAASFYAIAYDWDGERVISYRGTDTAGSIAILRDVYAGYGVGAGSPYGAQAASAAV